MYDNYNHNAGSLEKCCGIDEKVMQKFISATLSTFHRADKPSIFIEATENVVKQNMEYMVRPLLLLLTALLGAQFLGLMDVTEEDIKCLEKKCETCDKEDCPVKKGEARDILMRGKGKVNAIPITKEQFDKLMEALRND